MERVRRDIERFREENPGYRGPIPVDMATASGSGLDPHISPASARAQAERVAKSRGIPIDHVNRLIGLFTEKPSLGFIGDARVNVLELNLALDRKP